MLEIIHRVIARFLTRIARLKRSAARAGAVTLIQRFGSAANLNIHLHCLVLDGVPLAAVTWTLKGSYQGAADTPSNDTYRAAPDPFRSVSFLETGHSLAAARACIGLETPPYHGAHPDGTFVVVSDYFALAAILCAVVGIPATQLGRFGMGATDITIVGFDDCGPFLSLFNDRSHLAPV